MRTNDTTLVGSWRLIAYELEIRGRSERRLPMGPRPRGRRVVE